MDETEKELQEKEDALGKITVTKQAHKQKLEEAQAKIDKAGVEKVKAEKERDGKVKETDKAREMAEEYMDGGNIPDKVTCNS